MLHSQLSAKFPLRTQEFHVCSILYRCTYSKKQDASVQQKTEESPLLIQFMTEEWIFSHYYVYYGELFLTHTCELAVQIVSKLPW